MCLLLPPSPNYLPLIAASVFILSHLVDTFGRSTPARRLRFLPERRVKLAVDEQEIKPPGPVCVFACELIEDSVNYRRVFFFFIIPRALPSCDINARDQAVCYDAVGPPAREETNSFAFADTGRFCVRCPSPSDS